MNSYNKVNIKVQFHYQRSIMMMCALQSTWGRQLNVTPARSSSRQTWQAEHVSDEPMSQISLLSLSSAVCSV